MSDYIVKGLYHQKKQKQDQTLVMQWCINNHAEYLPVQPWHLRITLNKLSIDVFTVKQTWLNTQTGKRGVYTDLEEFLTFNFKD